MIIVVEGKDAEHYTTTTTSLLQMFPLDPCHGSTRSGPNQVATIRLMQQNSAIDVWLWGGYQCGQSALDGKSERKSQKQKGEAKRE